MPQTPPITRLLKRYFFVLLLVAIGALVVMMGITVANVFMRYIFNAPIVGAYDLVEICMTISVFLALPAVIFEGQPVVIDLIDGLVSPQAVKALKNVANAAAAIILCFVFWAMLKPAHDAYLYGDVKPEFGFPVWIVWTFALFGLFSSLISALAALIWPQAAGHTSFEQDGMA
jgi:TRAP-type transport system small permease protein